ncbi:MAG TPA: hypothetical protein VGS08_03610 [Candidatus Saccharimonadales bacterium]|nr:hypothetical protein [Candidatus Saccharimonadales bacterium]
MFFKRKQPTDGTHAGRRRNTSPSSPDKANVFSYYANRSVYSEKLRRKAEAKLEATSVRRSPNALSPQKRLLGSTVLVVVLVAMAINIRLSSDPKIVIVDNAGSHAFLQNSDIYQAAAHKLLRKSILNTNKITVSASYITQQLRAEFPELTVASMTIPFFGTHPTVYILPAVPDLILQEEDSASHVQQFVLDDTGRALGVLTTSTLQRPNVPAVIDQSGFSVHVGQLSLPDTSVSFITGVAGELAAEHVPVSLYTLLGGGASELDARMSGVSYYVKFNLHGDARIEVGDYLAVKQQLDKSHTVPTQYIDVRVDGRAYYL